MFRRYVFCVSGTETEPIGSSYRESVDVVSEEKRIHKE